MRLLLAEDDAILADALVANLEHAGFEVETAENGAVAEYLLNRQHFDAAILDIGLPLVDGLTVLKRVRISKPAQPILVLTALCDLEHRVEGLNAGADDYLTKPFEFPELEARVRALLRRAQPGSAPLLQAGSLQMDRDARRATIGGEPVDFSPREWSLLELLLGQRDKVVTKEQITQTWGGEAAAKSEPAGSIEVYIHRLRRKLEPSGLSIRTVRGLGYLLEADAKA
ncbi:response regulator transcription factor [Caldimonas caldifontis]|uniref:response regulator transcription factor n=1 Tax=Caldimonas caldifontis TaxID=1452508 RepID=UPI001474BAAE|nr:response regulator transcription factor [Caldimonas caldifontis]